MNASIVLISTTFLMSTIMFATYYSSVLAAGGIHTPEFQIQKNYTDAGSAAQTGINHPVTSAGIVKNDTITTVNLNATVFQQIDESQFKKAPEFAQISGYINTPNSSPITLSSLRGKVILLYIW